MKEMARADGGAVTGAVGWTVNGSQAQGRKMVRENSKLMLRAYNSEADSLVRGLKPYKLEGAVTRLAKSRDVIAKLGRTMSIEISPAYHRLRIAEPELTADYVAKVAEEKEREREEKARLREERKAQQELQRERERLAKERQHYANALAALETKGDVEAATKLRAQLDDVERAINDVDYRAANIRAGYVYVISNIGAFGERMIKIGMTRRLEPLDRVRELGDASVPFRFDVHALFFANDAVGIESAMHQRLADRRVNMVNLRREFFYATPQEAREHLLELAGDLLEYVEDPEALEFRQSRPGRIGPGADDEGVVEQDASEAGPSGGPSAPPLRSVGRTPRHRSSGLRPAGSGLVAVERRSRGSPGYRVSTRSDRKWSARSFMSFGSPVRSGDPSRAAVAAMMASSVAAPTAAVASPAARARSADTGTISHPSRARRRRLYGPPRQVSATAAALTVGATPFSAERRSQAHARSSPRSRPTRTAESKLRRATVRPRGPAPRRTPVRARPRTPRPPHGPFRP
jgi:hypothetical protein